MIFLFIAGYNLMPSIFWYFFCILLTFEINMFSKITDEILMFFTILIEFRPLFFFLLIDVCSIMTMLHLKDYNSSIIWICIATFFAPVIFYFLGFLKEIFFSFLNGTYPFLLMVFGCFLYYKYASSPGNSEKA